MKIYLKLLILSTLIITKLFATIEETTIKFGTDQEIEVTKYKTTGKSLIIVLTSEHGITKGLKNLAKDLEKKEVETWILNPYISFFLSPTVSSLSKIPIQSYISVIKEAFKTTKNIYLFSNDKASILALKTAHQWQKLKKQNLSGVILTSPNLYKVTPTAGDEGILDKIVYSTNLPISLLIPQKSTLALRIKKIFYPLKKGKSDIQTTMLMNVRDRFFFRFDATTQEKKLASFFATMITQEIHKLSKFTKNRKIIKIQKTSTITSSKIKKNTKSLYKYKGTLKSNNFILYGLNDEKYKLDDYIGKVVLVNFWASWCPPCVHEMPSMSRLTASLKNKPFTILAINLGEPKEDIIKFAKKHNIEFPILLDPPKKQAKLWKVFAFPTSYILDKKGKIRYSIAGGFDWDTNEVRKIITQLINE